MIKYLCDVKDCGKESIGFQNEADWSSQEMFELSLKGASYFWGRIGIANITLCPQHRAEVMRQFADKIKEKYNL